MGDFTLQVTHVKRQFTFFTCSLPAKLGKLTCFYPASTSRRRYATARNEARKLHVTSPSWFKLTYLHFSGDFIQCVIADCLHLRVFLPAIAVFLSAMAGIFLCISGYCCLRLRVLLPAIKGFLPATANCTCFSLQKQAIFYARCGQICTCKIPSIFR